MNSQSTKIHTDPFMKKLWAKLAKDFVPYSNLSYLRLAEEKLADGDITGFRKLKRDLPCMLTDVSVFKRRYQLDNLFKRYRFANDMFTDAELEEAAVEKFRTTQISVASRPPLKRRTEMVLQRAQSIIARILGVYDEEEHYCSCRFGKRASVGTPLKDAYLDQRLAGSITGSRDHIEWFKKYLLTDNTLARAIGSCTPMRLDRYETVHSLSLTNVPKSFKALRSIMPNTTIGGFYTYGLGKVIERRLASHGLRIRTKQEFHRKVIRKYSRTLSHVTADLSAASDSFDCELIKALVPSDWYDALSFGRIDQCNLKVGDKVETIHLSSFMTMGIGFTFPLQTLCFYGLLNAIKELAALKGTISVYGDDLIYPRSMHNFVAKIFTDLGFRLNADKTFVDVPFRESCGEDYYYGFAVRPYSPEGSAARISIYNYLALLYKTVNGLLRRWAKEEIPSTLEWLYSEIMKYSGTIFQVPSFYPDTSGVQVDHAQKSTLFEKWSRIKVDKHGSFTFRCLARRDLGRFVHWQQPYYWEALRTLESDTEPSIYDDGKDILDWVRHKVKPWRTPYTREKLNFRLRAATTCKMPTYAYSCQTGTAFRWNLEVE